MSGIDAVNLAINLETQKKRNPQEFKKTFNEPISYDLILKYLTREKTLMEKEEPLDREPAT